MNLYMLQGADGESPLGHRQMVSLRNGGLIHQCHKQPAVYHPNAGMSTRAVVDIMAVQPELIDCSFCNEEHVKWQYSFEPWDYNETEKHSLDHLGVFKCSGPILPYVTCEDCYILIETGASDVLGKRSLEQAMTATAEIRAAYAREDMPSPDEMWASVGPGVVRIYDIFIEKRQSAVRFDPARWRAGEVKPIESVPQPTNGSLL